MPTSMSNGQPACSHIFGYMLMEVNPGRVFDQTIDLEHAPEGYAAMDERTALKVMVTP